MPELVKVWTEYVALGVELTAAIIIALAALVGAVRALLAFVRPSGSPDVQNKSFHRRGNSDQHEGPGGRGLKFPGLMGLYAK
ncbi:hypothetical protein [Deinococcus aquaticus]|uniref:Uncharacterized protein n=1 Tax=Deinococcus aquaticus TaxID=328692 RepID=A0ABY7V0R0_9DEIO|nr:hypothetical protein [Deinococcus aquaticus]WDA58224.1 hypothetical protein M8445_12855 [Deinococcus aquaticus]